MKRTDAKHFSVNTEANTGERKPTEYCSVHPQKFCDSIKCNKCKYLNEYVQVVQWLCISCVDKIRDQIDVLPFHSCGRCDVCNKESVARILTERKSNEY